MDPQALWEELKREVNARELADAYDAADDLLYWLRKGGFPPTITGNPDTDRQAVLSVCRAVAQMYQAVGDGADENWQPIVDQINTLS